MDAIDTPDIDISYAAIEELASAGDFRAVSATIDRTFHHLLTSVPHEPPPAPAATEPPGTIGPWFRREQHGVVEFVKDADAPAGWAAVERIPQRTQGRRVVMIGESVARALLLDPQFNCAGVLREMCAPAPGEDANAIEIVDLARNAMVPPEALELMEAAGQLDPALYVVFAGNNLLAVRGVYDFDRASAAVKGSGRWRGVEDYVHDAARTQARAFVSQLAAIARRRGVPLLYVIPAYNQADWQPNPVWTNPLIAPAARRECARAADDAERLLAEERIAEAEAAAREVIRLEEDLSPHGLRLLARAAMARRQPAEARALLDRAADALAPMPTPGLLVCLPIIADALREQCRAEEVPFVDVPRLFAEERPDQPFGRELFLDNVHMSHTGVQIAMAGVAEAIRATMGLPRRTRRELLAAPPTPTGDTLAQAHFLTALFHSQQGQPFALIRYHTERAIEASAGVLPAMEVYVGRSFCRAPDLVCSGHEKLRAIRERFPAILRSVARPRWQWKRPHLDLMRLWTGIIRERCPASGLEPFDEALAKHYAIGASPLDLREFQHPATSIIGLPYRRHFLYTSRDPEDAFWFCRDRASGAVRLRAVTRVPSAAAGKTVSLSVNGVPIQSWTGASSWHPIDCVIPAPALAMGINIVRIDWPDAEESLDDVRERLLAFLAGVAPVSRGLTMDRQMYSVYGEICALSVQGTEAPSAAVVPIDEEQSVTVGGEPLYRVIASCEDEYSLWPADRPVPSAWRTVPVMSVRQECLTYIRQIEEGSSETIRRAVEQGTSRY